MIALAKQFKSTFADSSIFTMVIGLIVYYGRTALDQAACNCLEVRVLNIG